MENRQNIETADLVIKSSNELFMYSSLGSFHDANGGVYYYQDQFENANNKNEYIRGLNYCEFIYLLFHWYDQNNTALKVLSNDSVEILKSYRDLDFPELSSDFFEFHWFNSYCQFEDIVWHDDFALGIGSNGDSFLLNIDWHDHNLYVKQGLYKGVINTLENIKNEIISNPISR